LDSGGSALAPLLDGSSAGELIPELVRHGLQQLIELEVAAVLGAERHERSDARLDYRNGYRPRNLATQVGDIDLMIPKLRTGSYLPSILEPRRRVDQALYGVVMEAYVGRISTRKVDALVAALGVQSGISRSLVSRICAEIDVQKQAFLNRPLEGGYAYVYLDATYLHGRLGKAMQVCSRAVVVAMEVNADGRRELLGLKVGDSESEGFWSEFMVSLKQRRAERGQTRDQRGPRGPHQGDPTAAAGLRLAALPGELCPQPVAAGAQGSPGHGHGCIALGVCPGRRQRDRVALG